MRYKILAFILFFSFLLTKLGLCIPQLSGMLVKKEGYVHFVVFGNPEVETLELLTPISHHTITQGGELSDWNIPALYGSKFPMAFRLPNDVGVKKYPSLTFRVNNVMYIETPELDLEEVRNLLPIERQYGHRTFNI